MKRALGALAGAVAVLGVGVMLVASASAEPQQAKKPIVVGAVIAVSGPQSTYDMPPEISAEIAAQDINKSGGILGGRPIKVVRYDMKSDRTLGGTTALKAISQGAEVLLVTCDFDAFSCLPRPPFSCRLLPRGRRERVEATPTSQVGEVCSQMVWSRDGCN